MKNKLCQIHMIILAFVALLLAKTIQIPIGNIKHMEYTAFVRGPMNGDYINGPARQTVISGRVKCAYDWDGNIFVFDCYGLRLLRIDINGNTRVIAGSGDVGHQDGPADQASFTVGKSAYRDIYFDLACDGYGAVYVKDNPYVRKVYKNPDSTWSVSTLFGFGNASPQKGKWISLKQFKGFGGTQSFDVNAEGTEIWFNDQYLGLIRVCLDKDSVTCLATPQEVLAAGNAPSYYEPPGKCKLTTDSIFYFMIDRSTVWLTYDLKNGEIKHFAGVYPTQRDYDGTWRLDARWFATSPWHSIDGTLHLSSGEDEVSLRRIYNDTVKHLLNDGSWNRQNGKTGAWTIAGIKGIGTDGGIYCIPGQYQWPFALCKLVSDEYKTINLPELSHHTQTESKKTTPKTNSILYYPNPTYANSPVYFDLPLSKRKAYLSIFNQSGQLMLTMEILPKNNSRISWNGHSTENKPLVSGVYLARYRSDEICLSRRIVLMR